jgi:hypothetical protein
VLFGSFEVGLYGPSVEIIQEDISDESSVSEEIRVVLLSSSSSATTILRGTLTDLKRTTLCGI